MKIQRAIRQIIDFKDFYSKRSPRIILATLRKAKDSARQTSDEASYHELVRWIAVFKAQEAFLSCFKMAKDRQFYKSWCAIEKGLEHLRGIKAVSELDDPGSILFIKEKFLKLQKLFPYKHFGSPEFTYRRKCTICNCYVGFRKRCPHLPGKIYDGIVCRYSTVDFEFISIAIVENPVQKYSVLFGIEKSTGKQVDQYDYSPLELLFAAIEDPFEKWDYEWGKKSFPRNHFKEASLTTNCPCGSTIKFEECCSNLESVAIPHVQFIFSRKAQIKLKTNPPVILGRPKYELSNKYSLAIFEASDEDLF